MSLKDFILKKKEGSDGTIVPFFWLLNSDLLITVPL